MKEYVKPDIQIVELRTEELLASGGSKIDDPFEI